MLHQAQQCGPRRHQRPARLLLRQPVQAAIKFTAVFVEERLELGTSRLIDDILSERPWKRGHKRSISRAPPASKLPLIGRAAGAAGGFVPFASQANKPVSPWVVAEGACERAA